jgi:hypothetical protein
LKPQTGEPVWKYEISKRGLNTGAVVYKNLAIVTHSEENLESNEMGMIAALDATAKGELKKEQVKWNTYGWQGGYSSPVVDGDRLYQVDNGANIAAFDLNTGKQLWLQNLGTIQKASPVLADGKLYVGTENGKFFILRPTATGCEILDSDQLGTEQQPEAIIGSPAVSNGRIYFASDSTLYAIGKKSNTPAPHAAPQAGWPLDVPPAPAAHVQVVPTELIIKPGDRVSFRVRLFDERGNFIREEKVATWSLDGLKGTVANGQFVAAANETGAQAGLVKATVGAAAGARAGAATGAARVRILPTLPWSENFDAMAAASVPPTWVSMLAKFVVREMDGNKVLVKTTEGSSLVTRSRAYLGASNLSDYTVEADVRGTEKRRQRGDAGVIAQRYALVLYGNSQALHLEPWQPETVRTVTQPYAWKPDAWYHMKLSVENLPDGKTRARGKVWPTGETEPAAWMIERVDPLPNRQGAPGIFGNALAEVYFDNIKVTANK